MYCIVVVLAASTKFHYQRYSAINEVSSVCSCACSCKKAVPLKALIEQEETCAFLPELQDQVSKD